MEVFEQEKPYGLLAETAYLCVNPITYHYRRKGFLFDNVIYRLTERMNFRKYIS